ncbi:hypothetical protein PEP31012_03595 [Pandoraea eparura]|uniref:Uncharacterized protein n=1 Tax=Pandoraea eparura TaxID=2508291 RepID=A0A5E4WZT6_9BURK|nr:hypothetical protein PEP31012_03595 [Pandoraea eparura]
MLSMNVGLYRFARLIVIAALALYTSGEDKSATRSL